jgi:hypothetical protein
MINEHDLEDWEDKPAKTPPEATKKPTWGIPINPLLKPLSTPFIDVQIDLTIGDKNV